MDARANWDDLRFVLAVADAGSVAGAARSLSVNHATVLRRIAGFETRHGLRVFDKTAQGYRVADDRRELIEAMREAGGALTAVERMISDERPAVGFSIRITTTDSLSCGPLPGIAAELARTQRVTIDFSTSNSHSDFGRQQADIAVRPALRLPDELKGEAPVEMHFGLFEADTGSDGRQIGLSGPIGRIIGQDRACRSDISADSFVALASIIRAGRGRGVLPLFLGRSLQGLRQIDGPPVLSPVPVWVASHVDIYRSARLARARRAIIDGLEGQTGLFHP